MTTTSPASNRSLLTATFIGLGAVVVAVVVGLALAAALAGLGLTETAPLRLGAWLAGAGLLGGWSQDVSASVGNNIAWSSWAAGAPLLVTLAVMLFVALLARRSTAAALPAVFASATGAAVGAAILVFFSRTQTSTTNSAGTVDVSEGLTWLWTGGAHLGTVVGAAVLVGGTWWVNTIGLDWWRTGRPFAYGLLILPGLVLSVVVSAGLVYLTSAPAVGVAALLLYPLMGVIAILGVGGAPTAVGVTRLSPEPYDLWTWGGGLSTGLIGIAGVLVIAVIVGLIMRARKRPHDWLAAVSVPAAVAGFVAWATGTAVAVPVSLGGETQLAVNPIAAVLVGGVMAAVARLIAGSGAPKPESA